MNFASPHLTSFLSRHCPTDPDLDLFNSSRLVDQIRHCFHALIHTTEWQQIINLATASRFAQALPGFAHCLKVGSDCIAMCCRSWAGQCWAVPRRRCRLSIVCRSCGVCIDVRAVPSHTQSVQPVVAAIYLLILLPPSLFVRVFSDYFHNLNCNWSKDRISFPIR